MISLQDEATKQLQSVGNGFKALGETIASLGIAEKVKAGVEDSIQAFEGWQDAAVRLNSILSSTGDVSGVTAEQATHLAESLSQVTTFSKTASVAAESVLLRFTNISNDIFPQTLKATQDLATGLGTDLSSAAVIVGRALQQPDLASRSLRAANIVLNSEQQATIKSMVDVGDGAKAQGYILNLLQERYGGLSEAIGQTFGGQLKILNNDFEETKIQMGNVIAQGIGPLIDKITSFVANNQELISSFGIAALAAGGFAAAVIGVAGAIGLAVTIIGGPFTMLLAVLSVLLGGVVFQTVRNFQEQMKQTNSTIATGTTDAKNKAEQNFGAMGAAASKTAKELAKVDEQIKQSNEDFIQQMADVVHSNQQKVSDLQDQLAQEKADFVSTMTEKAQSYKDSLANMQASYDDSLADMKDNYQSSLDQLSSANQSRLDTLATQIDDENTAHANQHDALRDSYQQRIDQEAALNRADSQQKINNLVAQYNIEVQKQEAAHELKLKKIQDNIDKENALYDKQQADAKAKFDKEQDALKEKYDKQQADAKARYDKDVADATAAEEKKKAKIQKNLDEVTALLKKHATDVASVQNVAFQDEFDKLKASHIKELKQYAEQKQNIIENAKATAAGQADAYSGIPGSLLKGGLLPGMSDVGGQAGTAFGKSFATNVGLQLDIAYHNALGSLGQTLHDNIANIGVNFKDSGGWTQFWKTVSDGWNTIISNPNTPIANLLTHRANGGPVNSGRSYLVGEKEPEVFVPQSNGSIIPSSKMGGSVTINIYGGVSTANGTKDVEDLAQRLGRMMQAAGAGV